MENKNYAPVFTKPVYHFQVSEGAEIGFILGNVIATDVNQVRLPLYLKRQFYRALSNHHCFFHRLLSVSRLINHYYFLIVLQIGIMRFKSC